MHYLQKELYQRLKQDDSIFDFIQEAALDGLWYWDLEQPENEWMNQKFWTTLGYDPGEMPHTAAAWQNIIFEEDLEAAKKQIEDHFRQPEKYGYDQIVRYRHKKGHTVWIRCRGIARFSADGTPVRMLGAHTDVTELKRIESQYARQARYYRSLVETQTSYVCRLDFEGRYLYINAKLAEDFDIPKPAPDAPVPARAYLVEQDIARLTEICNDLSARRETQVHTYLRIPGGGNTVSTLYWEFTLITDGSGRPAEIQGVGLDFTSEMETRKALQQSNLFLEDAQRMARLGSWEKNLETGEERWSAMVYEIHELPASFDPGSDLEEEFGFYAAGESRQKMQQVVATCAKNGTPFDVEVQIRTGKGRYCWVRVLGRADITKGQVHRLYGTIQDIDERKQSEQRLIESKRQAEQRGKLLEAAAASHALLNREPWREALGQSLELFGKALDVERTYYFDLNRDSVGSYITMLEEWAARPELAQIQETRYNRLIFTEEHNFIVEAMQAGNPVEAIISEMAEGDLRRLLEEQDIKTIFLFPVFAENKLQGLIGFDDCRRERRILQEEKELISSFASGLGQSLLLQQKQEALAASEIKLRRFLDSTSDNIILLSLDYKVLLANRAVKEIIKKYYNEELHIGDDIRPYILPAATSVFENAIARAKSGEKVIKEFEADFGVEKRWLEFTYFPVYNPDGSLMGISFNSVDITPRKRAEEKLQASEKRLRGLLESQTNYLIRIDLLGNYTYTNQKFRDTFRFLHGDGPLLGRSSMESIMPEDHDMVIGKMMHLIEHPQDILQFEVRKPVVGGKAMTSLWEFSCITGTDGKPREIQCIGLDITDRKADEKKLREHEAYQRTLLRTIPEMLFVTSKDGRYLDYNANKEDLYRPPAEFLGKKIHEVMPAEVAECHYKALQKALKSSHPVEFTYSLGIGPLPRHFRARAVAMEEDKVLVSVSDVTESVNNLNRIKALLRTREEQNKRLRSFTHIVSHNLRNHTANIQGVLNVLEMDAPEIYAHEYIGMLQKTSDNLSETIKHLNEVLDIQLHKTNNYTCLKIYEVVETTAESIGQLARDAGVKIINDVPPNLSIVSIAAYLHSIVLNMITNGIKYRAKQRDSYIWVSAGETENGIWLSFKDNGLGIDMNKYGDKLFGMYKTFHHHKDSRGLGLFITKNQVTALGGNIEVKSEVDKGSEFIVFLPFETAKQANLASS